jgi:hypothetical protein
LRVTRPRLANSRPRISDNFIALLVMFALAWFHDAVTHSGSPGSAPGAVIDHHPDLFAVTSP